MGPPPALILLLTGSLLLTTMIFFKIDVNQKLKARKRRKITVIITLVECMDNFDWSIYIEHVAGT